MCEFQAEDFEPRDPARVGAGETVPGGLVKEQLEAEGLRGEGWRGWWREVCKEKGD